MGHRHLHAPRCHATSTVYASAVPTLSRMLFRSVEMSMGFAITVLRPAKQNARKI